MPRAFVFDAYGTLFDVHAAIGRHRAAAGPDADRFSEIWRSKAARIHLDAHARRPLRRLLDADRARARFLVCALCLGRPGAQAQAARRLSHARRLCGRAHGAARAQGARRDHRDPVERLAQMLAAAVEAASIGGDLDAVLSVDTIRMYKPRPEVYALVTERFKLAPRRRRVRLLEPLGRDGGARPSASGPPGSIAPGCRRNTDRRPTPCSPTSAGSSALALRPSRDDIDQQARASAGSQFAGIAIVSSKTN